MPTIDVLPRELCKGDVVLGLEDGVERKVKDVWYTSGFPMQWNGKDYRGAYSIDFYDGEWLLHVYDRPIKVERPIDGTGKSISALDRNCRVM